MTDQKTSILTVAEIDRLKAVERDVRAAMKEAIPRTKDHKKSRVRVILASQLGKLIFTLALFCLAGCGSSAGWRVSFGVAPVNAISDTQELTKEALRAPNGKY